MQSTPKSTTAMPAVGHGHMCEQLFCTTYHNFMHDTLHSKAMQYANNY